ncbi:manganese ABC transporter permease [Bacillus solimangrovi]|uniref:Manganese transport system membrane protein MntC n=2 Tax=Bacillus solimangrovi TaxID=1305675 RepID=A0A1E5LFM4_9BACI|nr:metal ABC transporter permease [Bacillus solimangrovi]OEH92856.1 manganese ABC transporter permease [Bacillus solimangrovi]
MLADANTQWVLTGTLLLGITSGVLGSFALLRKQSLLGDAMAHAALPGVCIAFMLYGEKSMPLFLLGAVIFGLLATYFIQVISKNSRIKEDTAIGLVLTVFFGFGIVLLTRITQSSTGNKSGLDDFIFGQAASLVGSDVKFITVSAVVLLLITALFFKEFKLLTFDVNFAKGLGLPVKGLNALLMVLIVGAVVIGIQAVGVVLMSAMLITPAIAARYWTEKLSVMIVLSGAIGGISGILGTIISTMSEGLATGPIIVIAATILFIISLLFAPRRGLTMKVIRHFKLQSQIAKENVLISLYELCEENRQNEISTFSFEQVNQRRPISKTYFTSILKRLEGKGFVNLNEANHLMLTDDGVMVAHELTLQYRMHEVFLMHEREFNVMNDDSVRFEISNLPNHVTERLKELLHQYGREPKLVLHSRANMKHEEVSI